ncbi:MAG: Ig domain-containing protein [Polynucleobacter sp.]|nr:MAG: Ig domain-containing protein [Polynucleobacter sp.]
MSNTMFHQLVAITDNQVLKAAGSAVFGENGLNVKIGEPVLFLPEKNLTIAPASIDKGVKWTLAVGGSVKNKKSGKADKLIVIGGSEFDLCDDKFKVEYISPCCGQDQKIDVYIGCVECDKSYPLALYVEDQFTRRRVAKEYEGEMELVLRGQVSCKTDCGGCVEDGTSFEVAKGWLDNLRTKKEGFELAGFGTMGGEQNYIPIEAGIVPSGKKIYTYCFTPVDSSCAKCTDVMGLTSISFEYIDANGDTQTKEVLLSDWISSNKTSISDIPAIADYLSKQLAPYNIFVHYNQNQSTCCKIEFEFTGCFEYMWVMQRNLEEQDVQIQITDIYDPFLSSNLPVLNNPCKGCNETTSLFSTTTMVRFYVRSFREECQCQGLPETLDLTQKRWIRDIQGIGENWHRSNIYVKRTQEPMDAIGDGIFLLHEALNSQHSDNNGFAYYDTRKYGKYGTAPADSQHYQAQNNISCEESYCQTSVVYTRSHGQQVQNGSRILGNGFTKLLIKKTDTLAIASLHTLWARLLALDACNVVGSPCGTIPAATGVTVTPATATLEVGEMITAIAVVAPTGANQAGTWTTSDGGIASVTASGDITAVDTGTATITFTSTDGSFTDTVVVTVS